MTAPSLNNRDPELTFSFFFLSSSSALMRLFSIPLLLLPCSSIFGALQLLPFVQEKRRGGWIDGAVTDPALFPRMVDPCLPLNSLGRSVHEGVLRYRYV